LERLSLIINETEINNIFTGCLDLEKWGKTELLDNLIPSHGYTNQRYANHISINFQSRLPRFH